MSTESHPPAPLQSENANARILKRYIWRRCNTRNQHFMGAIVGREGSGKSYTALKIGEAVDPGFHAGRVMFDPAEFLESLRSDDTGPGSVVVLDEAGVGIGVRTWYDEDQIKLNKVLQVIRDENMAALFTLPRLSELDSQARGRLQAFIEMVSVNESEGYATGKWKNIQPRRDESDKLYKKYPRMKIDGQTERVTSVSFTPPSDSLVEAYEERKAEFKESLYEEAISALSEGESEGGEGADPRSIAEEVLEDGVEEYVSIHGGNKQPYISWKLLRTDYDLSRGDAKTVKELLEKEVDTLSTDTDNTPTDDST